jgi:hypothetical protein
MPCAPPSNNVPADCAYTNTERVALIRKTGSGARFSEPVRTAVRLHASSPWGAQALR